MGALNALLGTEWDILGQSKVLGVVVIQALTLYPIVYLNTSAALANLDPAMDEAAENLGARRAILVGEDREIIAHLVYRLHPVEYAAWNPGRRSSLPEATSASDTTPFTPP